MTTAWNTRYIAYALAHGRLPEQQLAVDSGTTAPMLSFALWVQARWREYRSAHGLGDVAAGPSQHDAFDLWLAAKAEGGTR